MKRISNISIKNKFKTFSLSFDTKEFIESLSDNITSHPSSNIISKERRAWLKGNIPPVAEEIDQQLRNYFNIKHDNKLVFSVYSPPEEVGGKFKNPYTTIADQNDNVLIRIFICTISEQTEISYGKSNGEKMLMRPWEAYQAPPIVGGMLNYKFENKNHMTLEAKKGFRSTRRSKRIKDRYILLFDYMVHKDDIEKLTSTLTDKLTNKSGNVKDEFEDALKSLNS